MSNVTRIRDARHWRTGERLDLAFADGVIVPHDAYAAAHTIDARGAIVAPGLVDLHVHLREPGGSAKETIATGSRAAAAGGFTAIACMPNTDPVVDEPARVEWVRNRGREAGHCRVLPIAAVTRGQKGETLTGFAALAAAGAVALSDDGHPIASAELMRRALESARPFGLPIVAHEEDPTLRVGGHMNEGTIAARLGIRGIPAAAESVMVWRDLELAELTGGAVHLAHLSCAASLRALAEAHRRGLAVTGETCPHYWTLTEEAVAGHGTAAKMNPPLRAESDRRAVIAAIADGTLDCLATDHAPHTAEEKRRPFDQAPFGIVGLETALALTISHLVRPGHISMARAVDLWTGAPRRIFRLPDTRLEPGDPADFVVFDPEEEWVVDPTRFHSKGRNTPFAGWKLHGRVKLTVCAGTITHADEGFGGDASPAEPAGYMATQLAQGRASQTSAFQ